ncbi:TetR family transcriptional regulator [Mycolicibacterium sp. 018/SC-01/001]|uniref:TetR-like C-terminal domain-containing protein n=1 Tax=Mycolicibacterium sp. 018/SC-01/001 TaxID=2592069 RepID=UPI001180E7ED|nr:TetR-like C-terminal domain-containing protein [Mycolicibacterium sp. 018/SC-01/001]TRW79841.1 TetR family transcriptional regulator [Mycolicibacterium sp. 018/SC-01/001]
MDDSDAAIRAVAVGAALEELRQWGVDRFSIEGVVQRCDLDAELVGRFWPSPHDLIAEALLSSASATIRTPDTGSLARDLDELADSMRTYLNDPDGRRIARMLVIDSKSHTVDQESRRLIWRRHLDMVTTILDRASARGEVRPGVEPVSVMELLSGPLKSCALYSNEPIAPDYCRSIADMVTRAVSADR